MLTAPVPLKIESAFESNGRAGVLTVAGVLNRSSAGRLSYAVRDLVNRGARTVVIDLGGIEATDSRGAAELVFLMHRANVLHTAVFACRPPGYLREMLLLSRMIPEERIIEHEDEVFAR